MLEKNKQSAATAEEKYYLASQRQLMRQKFRRHKVANLGLAILVVLYFMAIFADFLTPYTAEERFNTFSYRQPTPIHFVDTQGRLHWPFVYGITQARDPNTLQMIYKVNTGVHLPIRFFVHAQPHKLLGIIKTDIHLFGVDKPNGIFLFGTDKLGRDVLSRILYASRVSLSIGLVGVAVSFLIGVTVGGISGYFGGAVDMFAMRLIEFIGGIPTIPFWIALGAALPRNWSVVQIYFAIVVLLSLLGWGGLARVVRGKLLELREYDYVLAARVSGVGEGAIIRIHLLPNFASYLIVDITLAIPGMILGESALSFLGLGMRPPAVSWGVMLQDSMNIHSVALYWWMVIPALFVIITVLTFNFLGDGLRDAADPYKQ